jgi:hypothetical protein
MPQPLKISALLLLSMLAACSTRQLVPPDPPELRLLPPAEISNEILLKQKITFEAAGRQQQFLVVARFQRQRLKLVLLLPAGQPLLTLDYDGQNFIQENQSSVDLPGKEILASMQFALWPEKSLLRHYPSEAGWQIEIAGHDRSLLTASGVILKIGRRPKTLVVDNHLHDYRVIIQTLEQKEL